LNSKPKLKLPSLFEKGAEADVFVFPEAHVSTKTRNLTVDVMKTEHQGFHFAASASCMIAVLTRKKLGLNVSVPGGDALGGRVVVIEGAGVGVVGVYAPNMHAKRADGSEADTHFFELLAGLLARHPVVALIGDLNLVWEEAEKDDKHMGAQKGKSTQKGKGAGKAQEQPNGAHAELRKRWTRKLDELGFGKPLDDETHGIQPTRWRRASSTSSPPASRVDFMFVSEPTMRARAGAQASAVHSYGRHKRLTDPDDHEHLPLWLKLRVAGLAT
jgi:exonuclease III